MVDDLYRACYIRTWIWSHNIFLKLNASACFCNFSSDKGWGTDTGEALKFTEQPAYRVWWAPSSLREHVSKPRWSGIKEDPQHWPLSSTCTHTPHHLIHMWTHNTHTHTCANTETHKTHVPSSSEEKKKNSLTEWILKENLSILLGQMGISVVCPWCS